MPVRAERIVCGYLQEELMDRQPPRSSSPNRPPGRPVWCCSTAAASTGPIGHHLKQSFADYRAEWEATRAS
ncbi:hypothetical protein ACIG5E_07800 [Kitasatospora sp. NPDC053057]|uniref:hypothetical protein n=1 Tax=Kitasatospora sp. NPDC053057 TaxID=3364062 RepID=UPI0037C72F12